MNSVFFEVSASGGEAAELVADPLQRVWVFLALCPYLSIRTQVSLPWVL